MNKKQGTHLSTLKRSVRPSGTKIICTAFLFFFLPFALTASNLCAVFHRSRYAKLWWTNNKINASSKRQLICTNHKTTVSRVGTCGFCTRRSAIELIQHMLYHKIVNVDVLGTSFKLWNFWTRTQNVCRYSGTAHTSFYLWLQMWAKC